ncbi:hypothetical protein EDC04DRAFT_2951781 [Pisolithus marmoratus]|nr:hypothetical protein EDC04DRAFT_2951781 [Pisolithus marmoratus]
MTSDLLPLAAQVPLEDLKRPTFGYSAQLGELFDERTSRFLGVQLYRQNSTTAVLADARRTDVALSSSVSLETDTELLDISAGLSLEIVGGLVQVGGSATYLKDTTSNSRTRSWVLALKVRSEEHRLVHAEEDMSSNVLDVVKNDYIPHATHFVSSITYGGNLIISMTARSMEVTDENMCEEKLRLQFAALHQQALLCATQAKAEAKARFKWMDSKFDMVVWGDIRVDITPKNPVDVLDIIPRATSLVCAPSNGGPKGVPVLVILRPIPKAIRGDCVALSVYRISPSLIHLAFGLFAQLEDIRKHCRVLTTRTANYRDFIPKLYENARSLSLAFKLYYDMLKEKLAWLLTDLTTSGKSDVHLFSFALSRPDPEVLSFEDELVALEEAFSHFKKFCLAVRDIPSLHMSTTEEVSRAACRRSSFHLLLVPLDKSGTMATATYYALLRNIKARSPQSPYIVYVEDPSDLVESLPNGRVFSQLKVPSYYIGTVDERHMVSWRLTDPQTFQRCKLLSWFPSMHQLHMLEHPKGV